MIKRILSIILVLCMMLAPVVNVDALENSNTNTEEIKDTQKTDINNGLNQDAKGISHESSQSIDAVEPAALADEIPTSGTCGQNATWRLEDDTLIISGTGKMYNYLYPFYGSDVYAPPWHHLLREIQYITIENGITSIGQCTFYYCFNLISVTIPNSVTRIEEYAFSMCNSLTSISIPGSVTSIGPCAFCRSESLTSISIPNSVTSIGDYAFDGCNSLTDVYYTGDKTSWKSIAIGGYNYALTTATIHYNSTAPDYDPLRYKIYTSEDASPINGYEGFDCTLEVCMRKTDATVYNPQLAHMLIAMCNSVHDKTNMEKTFESFEFNDCLLDYRIDNNEGDIALAYGIGLKQLSNGKMLVLIVARGTEGSSEIMGNLDAEANNIGEHTDFSATANTLYDHLMGFLNTVGKELNPQLDTQQFSNVQFVITGHSRGAAVANILAKNLSEIENGEDDNIYAYTFACPDTAVLTSAKIARYPTIFNIGNAKDFITWVPRAVWQESGEKDGWGKDSYWNKYGYNTYWFCDDWNNYNGKNSLPVPMNTDEHLQSKYLEYLRKEKPISEYKKREQAMEVADLRQYHAIGGFVEGAKNTAKVYIIMAYFWCPVNVEVYTSDGKLVGSVVDNEVSDLLPEKISVYIEDDQKYICLLDDDNYTFKVIGTDIGTMDYGIQKIDTSSYEILSEKQFLNVAITPQKQMVSNIDINGKEDISDIKLYICDDSGKITKEVQPDGNGTEIPVVDKIETPDTSDPDNTDINTPGGNTSNPGTNKPNPANPGNSGNQTKPTIKVKEIKLSGISHKIAAGKKIALTASVLPSNAMDKTVIWKSSNNKVATVNGKGVVAMKRTGKGKTVTITATAKDGSGTKATYKIKCMKDAVKKISISGQKVRNTKAGSTIKLRAEVNAPKDTNKTLKWISSNKKYASVSNKGKVITRKAGKGKTVKITVIATDGSGKKATVKIKIT